MKDSNNNINKVYMNLTTVNNWKERLKNINEQSIQDIESFKREFNNLETVMDGNIKEGILKDVNEDMEKLKNNHKQMEFMIKFLTKLTTESKQL